MINPDDANIIAAVRSVRRLTRDVAKLLTTAREFLEDAGWKSRTTQAISVSTSLNNAENWIPQDAFWFSFNERFPNHLLVVSVVFDSVENPNNLASPLVMAGYVRFAQPVRDNWSFRWSRLCEGARARGYCGVHRRRHDFHCLAADQREVPRHEGARNRLRSSPALEGATQHGCTRDAATHSGLPSLRNPAGMARRTHRLAKVSHGAKF